MRLAITGTSGLLGHDLWEVLKDKHELWGVGRRKPDFVPHAQWRSMDIVDFELTQKIIAQINPDCILHCAALSNPDDCEKDPITAFKANALGTRNLSIACQRFDTELLYFSTDLVFDGKKKSTYCECDPPNPVNHYGCTKLWGEEFVRTLLRKFYIVRTALVYGLWRATYVDHVVRALESGQKIIAATDIVNSPTYCRDLSLAIAHLIETHIYGTYHIVNEGYCSRYELACFIAEALGRKSQSIKKGKRKQLKLPALRPGFSPLENLVWNLNDFPKMRTWKEALLNYLEEMPG